MHTVISNRTALLTDRWMLQMCCRTSQKLDDILETRVTPQARGRFTDCVLTLLSGRSCAWEVTLSLLGHITHPDYLLTYWCLFSDVLMYGPRAWNSLPAELRTPDISLDTFRNKLKTFLFSAWLSMCYIVWSVCYRTSLIILIIIIIS